MVTIKRLLLSLLFVLMLVSVCIPQAAVFAADPMWMDVDWNYRKSFTVDESVDGDQTDYQMAITVNRGAGADAGNTVYVDGKCEADYDDIRVTNNSGLVLDYWIQAYDVNSATIWIELDSVTADDTAFWLYYGNAAAAAYSDGDDTWVFYDGFNSGSTDLAKWDVTTATGLSYSATEMIMTNVAGAYPYITSDSFWAKPLRHGVRTKFSATTTANCHFLSLKNAATSHYSLNYSKATANNLTTSQAGGGAATTNWQAYTDVSAYHTYMQTWQTDEILFYQDTTLKYTRTLTIPTADMGILFRGSSTASAVMTVDWVYIGKFTDDDLVVDTWGAQQQPSAPKVETDPATVIAETSATLNGEVTALGWCNIIERGFEYGTVSGTYTDNVDEVGVWGLGTYDLSATGLTPGTQYFYRAWARNAAGLTFDSLLNEETFTTLIPLPLPPTNLAGPISPTDNVDLTWTKGLYADNTTIVRHFAHFPTDNLDGTIIYSGPLALFQDSTAGTLVNLDEDEVFYSFWSVNATGTSLTYSTLQVGGAAMAAALGAMTNVFIFMVLCFLGVALLALSWWFRVGAMAIIAAVLWFVFGCYGVATGLMTDASLCTILGVISVLIAFVAAFLPMLWRKPTMPAELDDYTSIGDERDTGGETDQPVDDGFGRPVRPTRSPMGIPQRSINADNRRYNRKQQRRREAIEP